MLLGVTHHFYESNFTFVGSRTRPVEHKEAIFAAAALARRVARRDSTRHAQGAFFSVSRYSIELLVHHVVTALVLLIPVAGNFFIVVAYIFLCER